MIYFWTGKPGDGKTLGAVRNIVEDLIRTEVFVVTNIPLVLPRLFEYIAKRRPDFGIDELDRRVKVIDDAEVYEFYRHRSGGLVLPWSPDKDCEAKDRLPRPEFVAKMKENFGLIRQDDAYKLPVHYYIDEAHNFFSSREWATNGRGTLYYASQHRHLWDNVYLITQVMENVEKQLRGLVSETFQVRNQRRRSIGPVRMRPVFRVFAFYGVPTPAVQPYSNTTFSLDAEGVASCYKTVGALGVHTAPEKTRNKARLPWWTLPVGGAIAVLALIAFFVGLPIVGARAAKSVVSGGDKVLKKALPAVGSVLPVATVEPSVVEAVSPLSVVGVVRWGSPRRPRVKVMLSDGQVVEDDDPRLSRVGSSGVVFDGRVLRYSKYHYTKPDSPDSGTKKPAEAGS